MSYFPSDFRDPAPAVEAARERAVALLTDRYADDTLSEAEFEARLGWLTTADSVARIGDLEAELAVARPAAHRGDQYLAPPAATEERLVAVMSSSTRSGQWAMPELLRVRAIMSELRIDLRDASLPASGVLEVQAIMANVRILVPRHLAVECRVSPIMGSVRNDARGVPYPDLAAPRLLVTGSCVMAEVRIS